MNKPYPVSLVPLAALLLAGSALAQTISSPNPLGVDVDRVDRRCTSTTLSTDASAPCSDDTLNDGLHVLPVVVRPPGTGMAGSGNTSAGSTGTSMDTTGMPSTGTVTSSPSSIPGATAPRVVSPSGAVRTPAVR
jgi:hypothetical protein